MRRGWFHLASGSAVGRVMGFLSNLLLSRWLGPADLGLFNLVTNTVQTSDILVRCGGDYALNYELGGQHNATKTKYGADLARGLGQICSTTTLLLCIVVAFWVWWGQGLFPLTLLTSERFILTALLLLLILCEGISASAWEVLLVNQRTAALALRQGLFYPLRLLFAALGGLVGGVLGAMAGWSLIAIVQCIWLKIILKDLWNPLQIWPPLWSSAHQLLKRGLLFYASNLLASMIFYPLLLKVATGSGLSEIGYLRVGQILQQLFAFLPATLVPVLFLKLRGEPTFVDQVSVLERPLRVIWLILLEVLLLYCTVDESLIVWLFGTDFVSAVLPTRILLITALIECLAQLTVQPLLAAGKTRIYGLWQNGAAIFSAILGWLWIPDAGLAAYLIVRFAYVTIPFVGFGLPVLIRLQEPQKLLSLIFGSVGLFFLFSTQILSGDSFLWMPFACMITFVAILILNTKDLQYLNKIMRRV